MHDKIENVIKNYINTKYTEYAILINGEWGAGKTYFVNNFIDNLKESYNDKLKPIYCSLAGIDDIDKFLEEIFIQAIILNYTNSSIGNIGKLTYKNLPIVIKSIKLFPVPLINKFSDLAKEFPTLINNIMNENAASFENIVVFIDDVERLSNKIQFEDALYRIYEYLMLKKIKVIFVCNEKKLYERENNNKSYAAIKEKIIRHTINFYKIDSNSFLEKILDIFNNIKSSRTNPDYKNYTKYNLYTNYFNEDDHIKKIANIFIDRKHLNLRTFFAYLDMSKEIFDIEELKNNNDILEGALLTLALTLIECNNGNKENFKKFIDNIENDILDYIDNKQNYELEEYEKYKKDINELNYNFYFINNNSIQDIFNYVDTGYLSTEKIVSYVKYLELNKEFNKFYKEYRIIEIDYLYTVNEVKEAFKHIIAILDECDKNNKLSKDSEYIKQIHYLNTNYLYKYSDEKLKIYKNEIDYINNILNKFNVGNMIDNLTDEQIIFLWNEREYRNNDSIITKEKLEYLYNYVKEKIIDEIIKIFDCREAGKFLSHNPIYKRIRIIELLYDDMFLSKLRINPYDINIIIGIVEINIFQVNNSYSYFRENILVIEKLREYITEKTYEDYNIREMSYKLNYMLSNCEKHIIDNLNYDNLDKAYKEIKNEEEKKIIMKKIDELFEKGNAPAIEFKNKENNK
ncbi:KAP NTPase P-loop domain-containing protein [Brachyspira pilosicoli]|uniref:Putative KAP NTPase P-loop domain-containing protein n=1 Tax=Brachyspira pilosicoli (strain ATCC BAA-1826 / 95/1000) TaxID=759914 RepID=D8IE41_BRAP9|nr:KAP NTPase P-loop domain-containing protein [Brachyspira pilosicoli]ADK31414.1 putative KAP NTPase P-loop domain-containing protein [Brachyspira pilosicoli 95/1000]